MSRSYRFSPKGEEIKMSICDKCKYAIKVGSSYMCDWGAYPSKTKKKCKYFSKR